jgi:hypothetical protein
MAARRKLDRRRDDLCGVALRKRVRSATLSFVRRLSEPLRTAVLNIGPLDMILVKENIVQLPNVDNLSAFSPLFESALVLVRCDHVARVIVNANHGGVRRILHVIQASDDIFLRDKIEDFGLNFLGSKLRAPRCGEAVSWGRAYFITPAGLKSPSNSWSSQFAALFLLTDAAEIFSRIAPANFVKGNLTCIA